MCAEAWMLTAGERDNPYTHLPAWSRGNQVTVHVHGAAYFQRLVEVVSGMAPGDLLMFTDWRGDPDQRLGADGPTVAELLTSAADRGVRIRGLVWRSHLDPLVRTAEENRNLAEQLAGPGLHVLLDQRVRYFGSHHQKFVVARHRGRPERDVAFAGGIDLCHSRRDDAQHTGDPQTVAMAEAYGARPPWHDVELELRGPVVAVLEQCFRERWGDPTKLRQGNLLAMLRDRLTGRPARPDPLPPVVPAPSACGPHTVQVLRTYPVKRRPYPFAPDGERSIARGYVKAIHRARRLIYLEDQYMWSTGIASLLASALRANRGLHLVVVVPGHPDVDGRLSLPPNIIGRQQAIAVCRQADPTRVHVFELENHAGTPVYVHAKVCVIDDVWATVGSDNFNRRSWTHDSELSCAVIDSRSDARPPHDPAGLGDSARVFARDLRLTLMREHLDRDPAGGGDEDLLDPARAVRALETAADALDSWHAGGRRGPRPPGRLRRHDPPPLSALTRVWAGLPYKLFYDPDGRPSHMRREGRW
ncbi:phospholipase D family protein [Dactylosporangium matsuzakiense]|nr:phospholipase D family protein [Dactylosporangium matsuzakiense]UWZ49897.1 phospholipase [Dactylosporangium matsuzakiense]